MKASETYAGFKLFYDDGSSEIVGEETSDIEFTFYFPGPPLGIEYKAGIVYPDY